MKPEIKIYFSDTLNLVGKMAKDIVEVPLGKVAEYQEFKCKQLSRVCMLPLVSYNNFIKVYKYLNNINNT